MNTQSQWSRRFLTSTYLMLLLLGASCECPIGEDRWYGGYFQARNNVREGTFPLSKICASDRDSAQKEADKQCMEITMGFSKLGLTDLECDAAFISGRATLRMGLEKSAAATSSCGVGAVYPRGTMTVDSEAGRYTVEIDPSLSAGGFMYEPCGSDLCPISLTPLYLASNSEYKARWRAVNYNITKTTLTSQPSSLGRYGSANDLLLVLPGAVELYANLETRSSGVKELTERNPEVLAGTLSTSSFSLAGTLFDEEGLKVEVNLTGDVYVPELEVSSVTLRNPAPRPNEDVIIDTTVLNNGRQGSGPATLVVRLSSDAVIDENDRQLGLAVEIPEGVPAEGLWVGAITRTIPADVGTGTFRIGVCVSVACNELDTSNQCLASEEFTVNAPDLTVESLEVTDSMGQVVQRLGHGEGYEITAVVKNIGAAATTEENDLHFYIVFGDQTADITATVDPLPAAGGEQTLVLPRAAPPESGVLVIGACVDPPDTHELNTSNQCADGVTVLVLEPFACTGEALMAQNLNAQVSQLDPSVSPAWQIPIGVPAGIEINSLGFRKTDGLLYGVQLHSTGTVQVVLIDSTGTVFGLGMPEGLPANVRFSGGDFSDDGTKMYLNAYNQDLFTVVDLPSFTAAIPKAITGDKGAVQDWAYNPADGWLYGGDNYDGQLARLDPASGERKDFAVAAMPGLPALTGGIAFGGAWFEATGRLFLYQNSGLVFEIDLGDLAAPEPRIVAVQAAPASSRNDAAACTQSVLGAAKQMSAAGTGLPETITIEYRFENSSDTELLNLSAEDDLEEVFGAYGSDWVLTGISSQPSALYNPAFTGHAGGDIQLVSPGRYLLPGESAVVAVEIELLTLAGRRDDGYFCNRILVTAETPDGTLYGDLSTRGPGADPNGDGVPNERELTCISVAKVPFECNEEAFAVQEEVGNLYQLDTAGSVASMATLGREVNNLGFRVTDRLLYGVELDSSGNVEIVQIDAAGQVFGLGRPPLLPPDVRFVAGDVSADGKVMYLNAHGKPLYTLSLERVPVLPPVKTSTVTGLAGYVFDWAAHPTDGLLYGGNSTYGQVTVLDPETGERTNYGVADLESSSSAFGGACFDRSGRLVLHRNDGALFRVDLTGPLTAVSQPPVVGSGLNDDATCSARGPCSSNGECVAEDYCAKPAGDCGGFGQCSPRPVLPVPCIEVIVCGCDGLTYSTPCDAAAAGVNVDHYGPCP